MPPESKDQAPEIKEPDVIELQGDVLIGAGSAGTVLGYDLAQSGFPLTAFDEKALPLKATSQACAMRLAALHTGDFNSNSSLLSHSTPFAKRFSKHIIGKDESDPLRRCQYFVFKDANLL